MPTVKEAGGECNSSKSHHSSVNYFSKSALMTFPSPCFICVSSTWSILQRTPCEGKLSIMHAIKYVYICAFVCVIGVYYSFFCSKWYTQTPSSLPVTVHEAVHAQHWCGADWLMIFVRTSKFSQLTEDSCFGTVWKDRIERLAWSTCQVWPLGLEVTGIRVHNRFWRKEDHWCSLGWNTASGFLDFTHIQHNKSFLLLGRD